MYSNSRTPDRPRRGSRARRIALRTVAPVLLIALAPVPAGATPLAPAQSVASIREKAAKIAADLDRLNERESVLDEQQNAARIELADLEAKLAENQSSLSSAEAEMDSTADAAREYARKAFVGDAADPDPLRYLVEGNTQDESARRAFIESQAGSSSDSIESLQASQKVLNSQRSELDAVQAEVTAKKAEIERAKSELEASIEERTALQQSVNAELKEAVEAEQRRREAEAARRAAAEAAEREAAQAAAAQAQAAQTPTAAAAAPAAPATSGGGASNAPAPSSGGGSSSAPAPSAPAPPPPPTSGGAAGAIQAAKTQLGRMYRYGGSSPSTGFDCSGLMMWSWAQVGVGLPRTSRAQFAATQRISMSQIQPGDLVFYGSPVYHVGMYVGGGMMIDSPRTGKPVSIRPVGYIGTVSGVGRVR